MLDAQFKDPQSTPGDGATVVVLIRIPCTGIGSKRLRDTTFAGLPPSINWVRCIDKDNIGGAGSKHPPNARFHRGIGDNRYRIPTYPARQSGSQTQAAASRLNDPRRR
ncbi:hypothetical protein AWC17_19505 [Mycobacterium nebraskense]|uniref:Uncharacterized protein n=1 Tax=Mycobacterium nebraskense TaxID=244292 RepID=A0A1X1YTY7_9MYCO|nr:hypothetical protein [Mycobacterium nebraskense]ORW14578.1 hypothetical protein AWC17_19505 [Mycobacterium nebraskense]